MNVAALLSICLSSLSFRLWSELQPYFDKFVGSDFAALPERDSIPKLQMSAWENVFRHYLVEVVLEDDTVLVLENCVDDVFLYISPSSRKSQQVRVIDAHTPDCSIGITLGKPSNFRNDTMRNNCKHLAWKVLTDLCRRPQL